MIIGIGIKSTISISNTIKIIANKKNRKENGIRELWFGSNPHSKGDNFSRSVKDFIEIIKVIISTTLGISAANVKAKNMGSIY
jgi:hypothetical protein